MNTSYSWIKMYVPGLDVTAQEYTDAMTLTGTKVEGFEKLDQDLDKIQAVLEDPELSGEGSDEMDALLYSRNRNWVEKLITIMPERACLVCVGAGHLPGEQGLLQLLRNAGYTVEPVQ